MEKQAKSENSAKQPIANNIEESVTSSIVIPGPQVQVDVDETKGKAKIIELSGAWKDQLNKKLIDSAVVEIPLDDVEPIRQSEYFNFFSLNSILHSLSFTFLVDLISCSKNIPQYYAQLGKISEYQFSFQPRVRYAGDIDHHKTYLFQQCVF